MTAAPATSIVREKQRGTLILLLNSPLRPWSIYAGKLIGSLGFVLLLLLTTGTALLTTSRSTLTALSTLSTRSGRSLGSDWTLHTCLATWTAWSGHTLWTGWPRHRWWQMIDDFGQFVDGIS